VPLELSDAIAKALKRNPDHRYQFARQLEDALGPRNRDLVGDAPGR
jgi:hypothetical protein